MALAILVVAGTVAAHCCCYGPGVRSQGYWKNHPDAWPRDTVWVGKEYCKAEAITILQTPGKGDKSYTLFNALLAAELNQCAGNCTCCIEKTICKAHEWCCEHPPGSGVTGNSCAWKYGELLYCKLDAYNNGYLCAPSAD